MLFSYFEFEKINKMDFESPDVEKDFPGLYASEVGKRNQESEYSDDEKVSRKDLLIGKRREKRDSKKDKGYVAFEGESSDEVTDETRSPGKSKKLKTPFKFPGKDKKEKSSKTKDLKDRKEDDTKDYKKESSKNGKKKKERKLKLGKLKEKKKKLDPVFGVPLHLAVERSKCQDGIDLPAFLRECIDYIEEHGLPCEGIYRISGVKSKVQQLKTKYNQGERVYLYEHEPHTVASLIKQFLRDLPESILTNELDSKFEEAVLIKGSTKRCDALKKLVESLPTCNRLLLSWIYVHMINVIRMEKNNKMSLQNVIIVLGPTLQISHHILEAFFTFKDVLFKGVEIKKYQTLKPDSSKQSLELPDTPATIEDELSRQEAFLAQLHAELNTGLRDKQKEEQLWEIQRIVTQLKRKLRFLNQSSKETLSALEEEPVINTKLSLPKALPQDDAPLTYVTDDNVIKLSPKEKAKEILPAESLKTETGIFPVEACTTTSLESEDIVDSAMKSLTPTPNELPKVSEEKSIVTDENTKTEIEPKSELEDEVELEKIEREIELEIEPEPVEEVSKLQHPDLEYRSLWLEEQMLLVNEDELSALNRELQRKLSTEKNEIERLKGEICDYQQIFKYKQYSIDSSENSSDSESSEDEEEEEEEEEEDEDLKKTLEDIIKENYDLDSKNIDLVNQIRQERDACIALKVEIKVMQQLGKPLQQLFEQTKKCIIP